MIKAGIGGELGRKFTLKGFPGGGEAAGTSATSTGRGPCAFLGR